MCRHLLQLLCSCLLPKPAFCKSVSTQSVLWNLSGDPGVHCRESQRLPSRKAQFPLQCKGMITTDVSSCHLHAKRQYSGFLTDRSRRKWPINKAAPNSEVLFWRSSSYSLFFIFYSLFFILSLFLQLVPQFAHLIKPEMSFLPVSSAAVAAIYPRAHTERDLEDLYFHLPGSIFLGWEVLSVATASAAGGNARSHYARQTCQ